MTTLKSDLVSVQLRQLASDLLNRAGLKGEVSIFPLRGGRNNRVYRLKVSHEHFLFKKYFYSQEDSRDRLKHEYLFLDYLFALSCSYTPRPYACDPRHHVTLMEFVEGTPLTISEIDDSHIEQAIDFFYILNSRRDTAVSRTLPIASEACFSFAEHLALMECRIDRLERVSGSLPIDLEAREFVQMTLKPLWRKICKQIQGVSSIEEVLPLYERCLSPSDFGFHNALRQSSGSLKFVDFEYAGWDDPAKLIIDFANQPDMTLDRKHSDRFRSAVIKWSPKPDRLLSRVILLEPLYQLKWACICLNDFLSVGRFRRDFRGEEEEARKAIQLVQANKMVELAKQRSNM